MTAAITSRPTASRIGPITAWRAERSKVRRMWFLGGVVILSIFAQLLGVWNYTNERAVFDAQGVTWLAIWVQGAILVTSIFLPLLYVVILAQAGALEYQSRGWQRLASMNRTSHAIIGKILVALELALVGMAVYLVAAIIFGIFLGFDPSDLAPYLARALCGAFGAWAVGAVTLMISTWFRTFAASATAALAATMVGMLLTAVAPDIASGYPFTLITIGLGGRDMGNFASLSSMMISALVSIIWIVLSFWIMKFRLSRREW